MTLFCRNFDRMCQLISDAVATSDSDWHGRPSVRDYLTLLYGGHKVLFWVPHYNPGTMLGSMGTLLISIEKLVRKPGTSSDEVKELRKQRKECIETYISAVCDCGPDMELYVLRAFTHYLTNSLTVFLQGRMECNSDLPSTFLGLVKRGFRGKSYDTGKPSRAKATSRFPQPRISWRRRSSGFDERDLDRIEARPLRDCEPFGRFGVDYREERRVN